jgi:protein subunit release factor A
VDAVLEQAGWVGEKLDKAVVEYMENEIDIADECNDKISESVNNYFSYEFTLTDHCDIDDIVADKVDDRLEEMVNEKLQEMLSTATITFNN